uniref:synaptic vesicle glycoprotein 2C-like n=1 Tax=Myxine glutinosa TaxID=7769 RepID=UPI00358F7B2D
MDNMHGYQGSSIVQYQDHNDEDSRILDESHLAFRERSDGRTEDGASSEETEGHDNDDEIYEGEYQGIPAGSRTKQGMGVWESGMEAELRNNEEELAEQYEVIMQECGHSRFQWLLYLALGFALMADGVEVFVVGFVLPSAEQDMCMPQEKSSWMGICVYVGMMLGALFWGGLADKIGRRQSLLMALSFNSFFTCFSSFMQSYEAFLFCHFFSGFGIGGTAPIAFPYFAEFLSRDKRGEHLSWLCMFGMIGGIYASALAWAIIPHYGWSFSMGSAYQFHSWRVFVITCALPAMASIVAITFMPESPRFLLQMGWHDKAWMVLKQVHDTNMRAKGTPEKVFSVHQIGILQPKDEIVEIQTDTGTWYQRFHVRLETLLHQIWKNFLKCFEFRLRRSTVLLMAVWLTLSFGYFGLSIWFPKMIQQLQDEEYDSRVKIFDVEQVKDFTFNFTLENQIHLHGKFVNVRFLNMKFKSVTFIDFLFDHCDFDDVTSMNTYFKNCTVRSTAFYNTDISKEKFINSHLDNCTFELFKQGCYIDFSNDYSAYWVYFVTFLGILAVLPGNIMSALFMDKVGRLNMLGGSMVISAISCFLLWFGNSQAILIGILCLYNGLSISAWNSLDVLTTEIFPADRRTSGFGFLSALGRLGTIFGSLAFGSLVLTAKAYPILLASSLLLFGGLVAFKLPDTHDLILM